MSEGIQPDLSVVIPIYNRGELVRHTLESVRRASPGLAVEEIVVDDGSSTPAAESIARLGFQPDRIIRQANQGLLFARLAGLKAATGRYVLFLDSDDVVSPEKFRLQVAAMDEAAADASYTDVARCVLPDDLAAMQPVADEPVRATSDVAEFFLSVQPAPHSPVFRTSYLQRIVHDALFPPSPAYNSVAEIWFYFNAATRPARILKAPGPHTIVGLHPGVRLSNHWEKLGLASLAVMEAFARSCPRTPDTLRARTILGECAFISWRRLPRDFHADFDARMLALWRDAPRGPIARLGERRFVALSRLIGPERAGRILRRLRGHNYASCRTLSDAEYRQLSRQFPAPLSS